MNSLISQSVCISGNVVIIDGDLQPLGGRVVNVKVQVPAVIDNLSFFFSPTLSVGEGGFYNPEKD